ncbi:hypothetical protein ACFV08_04310 [Streptomyces fradiae]|uniref:hypothetical protein n=1 Tax=Streptomyces fradiae TaxID=1906 RepID=UPI0036739870
MPEALAGPPALEETLHRAGHAAARSRGLVPALLLLHTGLGEGIAVRGARGWVVAPTRVTRRLWSGEGYVGLPAQDAVEATPAVLDGLGLTVLHCRRPGPVAAGPAYGAWLAALAWTRLGHSRHLLDLAVAHLGRRTFDGAPLLHRQLVQGTLADAVVAHLEAESALDGAASHRAALAEAHTRITAVDRELVRLFGAAGFTADGPGRSAHASELLADVYAGGTPCTRTTSA